jgi:hypothetical protein
MQKIQKIRRNRSPNWRSHRTPRSQIGSDTGIRTLILALIGLKSAIFTLQMLIFAILAS